MIEYCNILKYYNISRHGKDFPLRDLAVCPNRLSKAPPEKNWRCPLSRAFRLCKVESTWCGLVGQTDRTLRLE